MRTTRSRVVALAFALIVFTGASACGNNGNAGKSKAPDGGLEVFSWWTSGGEQQAFEALVSEFRTKYPNVFVINAAQAHPQEARTLFEARMTAGDPPDTFQSLAGTDLFKWVGDGANNSKIVNLDALAEEEGWKSAFNRDVLSTVTVGSSMYAVPINVHRINTVMYNPKVFADNNLSPPNTIADMKAVARALKDKRIPALGLGVRYGWAASLWIIDSLFAAVAGAEHRQAFLLGELGADDARFRDTLETAADLVQYSNGDRDALDWDQAAALVASGRVAMNPMGDWAYAELKVAGARLGVDFDVMVHPGAQGIFVLNSDTFPITVGAKNRKAAEAWLKVVGSESGQTAFNVIKGSIPARIVNDTSRYDAYAKRSLAEFAASETKRASAYPALIPVAFAAEMDEQMRKFVITGNIDALLTWFTQNYERLRSARYSRQR